MPRPLPFNNTELNDTELNSRTVDVIGNLNALNTLYFPNSNLVSAINAVPSIMSKTFYVDSINGNDSNDGSSSAPFQTVEKAIYSVPIGGHGTIVLANNQTHDINNKIWIVNKVILFRSKDLTSTGGAPDDSSSILRFTDNGTDLKGQFRLKASHIQFSGWSHPVRVQVGSSQTEINGSAFDGHLGEGYDGSSSPSSISFAHTTLDTYATAFFLINFIHFRATAVTVYRSDNILINMGWNSSSGVLQLIKSGGYIHDASGNDISTSCISGIVKDANGVPRNIVSNIVL